jgi:hypothetical protein
MLAESARAGAWKRAVAIRLSREHNTLIFRTNTEENDIVPLSMFADSSSVKVCVALQQITDLLGGGLCGRFWI